MPFKADSRCGLMNIELNVNVIWEELETLIEKDYDGSHEDMEEYTRQIEVEYTNMCNKGRMMHFWDWFLDNYRDVDIWDTIEANMKEREGRE